MAEFWPGKALEEQRQILLRAFDLGITHFDLANNYGAPARGKAEENFGKVLASDLKPYRQQLFISTKQAMTFGPAPMETGDPANT